MSFVPIIMPMDFDDEPVKKKRPKYVKLNSKKSYKTLKKGKGVGMGWYNEPLRHSLARKGIKTGRKSMFKTKTYKLNLEEVDRELYINLQEYGYKQTYKNLEKEIRKTKNPSERIVLRKKLSRLKKDWGNPLVEGEAGYYIIAYEDVEDYDRITTVPITQSDFFEDYGNEVDVTESAWEDYPELEKWEFKIPDDAEAIVGRDKRSGLWTSIGAKIKRKGLKGYPSAYVEKLKENE